MSDQGVIVVVGPMGSGKTTFSRELAEHLEALWLSEPDEKDDRNPYLADYYSDAERWAFTLQVHMLETRYRQHQNAQWHVMNEQGFAVLDSSYWQDTAYAHLQLRRGLMSQREFNTYAALYHGMTATVLLPSVCVRVMATAETCAHRMRRRMERETGRKCEQGVGLDYLRELNEEINSMVDILGDQGVLVLEVPWDEDREDDATRNAAIAQIAKTVRTMSPRRAFLDTHRRAV